MTDPAAEQTAGRREVRKADTRRALEDAALRRFARDGYDATSVEAVAADAGVSARTFFRYFATKDEVLDMGRAERQADLVAEIRALDEVATTELEVVRLAIAALATSFAQERARVELRSLAASSSMALRGRIFDIFSSWESTIARALVERSGDREGAETLAAVGIGVFRAALVHWVAAPESDLVDLVDRGFSRLHA